MQGIKNITPLTVDQKRKIKGGTEPTDNNGILTADMGAL